MAFNRKINVQIPVNWLFVIFGVVCLLISAFLFGPERWRPQLVYCAAVLAAGSALANAANALDSRSAQRDSSDKAAKHARVVAAMEYIDKWNAPAFYYCKKNGRAVLAKFKTMPRVEEQLAYLDEDPERRANLTDILNFIEALSLAVTNEVVDEPIVKRFYQSLVVENWHNADDYIKKRRAERNNARLYREFEVLYERWKN